ncbi:MAG: hypothetical protein QOF89_760 [Acidobacteriota bacterium]|jgi:hypothetical protein|nr:hypothetical protein [Acidobacteriota bacterium]
MKRTTLITTALLALLLAPAVQAQYGGYGSPDRYRDRYPDYGHMDRVSALAHDIDTTARSIYREAARNNRRPSRYEAQMLDDLYQLYGRADRFHDQVESDRRNPRRTAAEFAELERAFNRLGETMQYVHPRSYVDRGMERIYSLMTELSRYYGRTGYDRWGHYGRGDRDRYDRNDRDRDGRYDRDDDSYRNRPPH